MHIVDEYDETAFVQININMSIDVVSLLDWLLSTVPEAVSS